MLGNNIRMILEKKINADVVPKKKTLAINIPALDKIIASINKRVNGKQMTNGIEQPTPIEKTN